MYKLLASSFIACISGWIVAFLIPLVVQDLTDSALYTAITYGISTLPFFLVTPFAGVLGDHFNKKRMIQLGELANVVFIGLLMVACFIPNNLYLIFLLHFMLCSILAMQHPIFQAMIPEVVAEAKVKSFNAYTGAISNLITLSAPILVALCLGIGNISTQWFIIDAKIALLGACAVGYFLSFGLISWMKYAPEAGKNPLGVSKIFHALQQGLQYVNQDSLIKYAVICFFFGNFGSTFINANLVHYLKHYQGIGEAALSYYFLPSGIGALIGSLLAPFIIGKLANGKIIVYINFCEVIATALMLCTTNPWVIMILWGVNSLGSGIIVVTYFTLRQKVVPNHLLSRTVAVTRMISHLAIPLASICSGLLFDTTHNFRYLILVGVLANTAGLLLCWKPLTKPEKQAVAQV